MLDKFDFFLRELKLFQSITNGDNNGFLENLCFILRDIIMLDKFDFFCGKQYAEKLL